MGLPPLVLALWASAPALQAEPAQAGEPELVILPLDTEGVGPQLGIDAWKTVVAEIAQGSAKLKVSLARHSRIHDLLLGPAREQARDCGANLKCLREIGATLGAHQVVAGRVARGGVSLSAIDIRSGARLATARSSSPASSTLDVKSKSAARNLIAALRKKQESIAAAVVAPRRDASEGSVGETASAPSPPLEDAPALSLPEPRGTEPSLGEPRTPDLPDAPPAPSLSSIEATPTPSSSAPSPRPPDALAGGKGPEPLVPPSPTVRPSSPEASAHSSGRARRDPAPESLLDALFRPDEGSEASAGSAQAARARGDAPVTEKWWFWTTLGLAVFGGAVTAALLSGGLKGGPTVPSSAGTITGTY